ncbi:hypothetical protein C8R44DRAFT_895646 [Mycena epipterygia]|nr:hypothetical protein C8R44DRAFT_895646 [Mycena epipterygia]
MADDPHTSPPEASSFEYIPASPSVEYADAFITNSRNFTIAGGNFTSVIHYASAVPSDFRTIPLGDLDLRNEIRLDDGGMVNRQRGLLAARRIYTARIEGKQSDMTVAVYQGENAEETWKGELTKYSGLRHPNIIQLYGAVNSGGLYATIFHDDLVPFKHFMDEYRHSVIFIVYLYSFFTTELDDAEAYVESLRGISQCISAMNPYLGYGVQPVDSALKLHLISPTKPSHIYQ